MKICWLAALLVVTACMPSEQDFNPATANPKIEKNIFTASDGATLPMREWLPKRKPKAVVVSLHGFNDYSNGFIAMGEAFKKRGIATFAYDQRGFGSTKDAGIWGGEQNLVRDAVTMVAQVKQQYPNTPIFMVGESMGGAVAILASSQADLPDINGVLLIAPAVWDMGMLPRTALWSMAHIMPSRQMTGKQLKIRATNNTPVLRRLSADPLVIKATRVDAIYGITQLMGDANAQAANIKPPVLLLYGGQDQVIPPEPVESVVRRLPKPFDVAYYEDGYHMLTRDIQGAVVISDMADWILRHRDSH